ncbi:acyltransferase [Duncaniella freteri]|uniref:acyltransferase n=1 Tax=Duncaniella freteri TaxID=2530391 RepID=UPI002557F94B|nr:acyltransferase [Duncaniella freteri]
MIFRNIILGENVQIDPSSSINNVQIDDNVKIAKRVSIFGSPDNLAIIGKGCYIGMNTIINGYAAPIVIGKYVSFAQNVNIMTDSGPNASSKLQKIFPLVSGKIKIGDNSWIGASSIIMPGVSLGRFCIVAANSFVTNSFQDYAVIGGTPAKLIRYLTPEEIKNIES